MGICLCKAQRRRRGSDYEAPEEASEESSSSSHVNTHQSPSSQSNSDHNIQNNNNQTSQVTNRRNRNSVWRFLLNSKSFRDLINATFGHNQSSSSGHNTIKLHHQVDRLVIETLSILRTLPDNEQDPPEDMLPDLGLQMIADKDEGWLTVVNSLINVIPINDPLGPTAIVLLLDDLPLPTKESILKLADSLDLRWSTFRSSSVESSAGRNRNICVVLGCLVEKLARPYSITLMTDGILEYLTENLVNRYEPSVVLFSLIALEKFAQTAENKLIINSKFLTYTDHPLVKLENWHLENTSSDDADSVKKEVAFCAQWSLDNLCEFCWFNQLSWLTFDPGQFWRMIASWLMKRSTDRTWMQSWLHMMSENTSRYLRMAWRPDVMHFPLNPPDVPLKFS